MKEMSENVIKVLCYKINDDVKADDALKFTQAALNIAHAAQVMSQVRGKRKG